MTQKAISSLIEEANMLLTEQYSGEELLERFESYLNSLEAYLGSISQKELTEEEQTALTELLAKHNTLLNLAQNESKSLASELATHKQRGKALMRYVDQLPKRLSSSRGRKG